MSYLQFLDKVIDYYASSKFSAEVEMAKKEFFGPTASFEEDGDQFDARMAQFLDWYVYDRDQSDVGLSPLESIKEIGRIDISDDEKPLLDRILSRHHSIFEFLKIKGSDVYIKDLIRGKKFVVKDSAVTIGFDKNELFEARLIPHEKTFVFSRGFCFHPSEAKKYILQEIKKVKKLGEPEHRALIEKLATMRLKFDQYKHIKPEYIYTNDTRMKI